MQAVAGSGCRQEMNASRDDGPGSRVRHHTWPAHFTAHRVFDGLLALISCWLTSPAHPRRRLMPCTLS